MSSRKLESPWALRNRLSWLIEKEVEEKTRFKDLEAMTGIKTTQWRDFFNGKQRPTAEMIEAAGRLWPEYAFWLITGVSDAEYGHIAPYRADFPCKMPLLETPAKLFKKSIEAVDACIAAMEDDPDYSDPVIQQFALLEGHHRSAIQLGFTPSHEKKLRNLFKQIKQLQDARELENEVKMRQPKETYEETERELPKRTLLLKKLKPTLVADTVDALEQQLKAERDRLERYRRIEKRHRQTELGKKED